MASYVNVRKEYSGAGNKDAIQLNRWSRDNYSISLDVTGTIDVTVQMTLDYINRPLDADFQANPTPVWTDITGLTNVTTDTLENIANTPMEAIRLVVNSGAGSVVMHVMQNGEG